MILPYGRCALLLELGSLDRVHDAYARLRQLQDEGEVPWSLITDLIPGARSLVIISDEVRRIGSAIEEALSADAARAATPPVEVQVPVTYDGADLSSVAELTGLSVEEVIAAHTAKPWTVAFGGFAPGFAYLVDGDPQLRVPRLPTPRTRVPAGAVGLADEFSGIYPASSPGGWRLIGTTSVTLFDQSKNPPALLQPGTRVRFSNATGATTASATPIDDRTVTRRVTGRTLKVVATRLPILVQDSGRPGFAAMGVSPSGAADQAAYERGARLVGNWLGEAALEITLGSAVVQPTATITLALTGADCGAEVDGRPVAHNSLVVLHSGQRLSLGMPRAGLRTYLSVHGGIDVEPVMGSRSHDTLGQLGPAPILAGGSIPIGPSQPWNPVVDFVPVPAGATGDLYFEPGPQSAWLTSRLDGTLWRVGQQADRVGVRLSGNRADRCDGEVPSQGTIRGAVQLPPSGEPVLFLADHPPTGGYPVVAVLTPRSVDRAAQLRPGQQCRLKAARHR